MSANQNKCLAPNGNGTANNTTVVVADCNGSSNQAYTAMPMSASGVYAFKNVASGRCLNVAGPSTSNGALLQLYDCGTTPGTNAQFSVQ
jgi:Ricin-type beta-trefoil lectin domain-like